MVTETQLSEAEKDLRESNTQMNEHVDDQATRNQSLQPQSQSTQLYCRTVCIRVCTGKIQLAISHHLQEMNGRTQRMKKNFHGDRDPTVRGSHVPCQQILIIESSRQRNHQGKVQDSRHSSDKVAKLDKLFTSQESKFNRYHEVKSVNKDMRQFRSMC